MSELDVNKIIDDEQSEEEMMTAISIGDSIGKIVTGGGTSGFLIG